MEAWPCNGTLLCMNFAPVRKLSQIVRNPLFLSRTSAGALVEAPSAASVEVKGIHPGAIERLVGGEDHTEILIFTSGID